MSRIFITGDIHGELEVERLGFKKFPKGKELTKDDYVIICGDFGLVWEEPQSKNEAYWLNWLEEKPFTTLFVDGNHENHVKLNSLPVEEWHGGKVHKIMPSVIHLMRGQIYDINGYKWFTYGGAESTDRMYRQVNVSWWPQETPSLEEYNEAIRNLRAVDFKVDFIISHAAPRAILENLYYSPNIKVGGTPDQLNDFKRLCQYQHWYCGHYHFNCDIRSDFHIIYHDIREINFD